ncbi:MAG: hypothetical protein HYR63_00395 [Proteobacteria bacterium]|nr:hypothetical protein [Pseudomonadota bacterium]
MSGGDFEFASFIRSTEHENDAEVSRLLRGDRSRVKGLGVRPGTLILFCGKYSVPRVSPNLGKRPRMIAIFRKGVSASRSRARGRRDAQNPHPDPPPQAWGRE